MGGSVGEKSMENSTTVLEKLNAWISCPVTLAKQKFRYEYRIPWMINSNVPDTIQLKTYSMYLCSSRLV